MKYLMVRHQNQDHIEEELNNEPENNRKTLLDLKNA